MAMPALDFWFDFASTYSYPAAMRIGALAAHADVRGALSAVPARADLQGAGLGHLAVQSLCGQGPPHVARPGAAVRRPVVPFRRPDPFPQNSLLAARVALVGLDRRLGRGFLRRGVPRAIRRRPADRRCRARSANLCRLADRRRNPSRSGRARTPDQGAAAGSRPRKRSSSACSARRASRPRTANCSGATTGSNTRCAGRSRTP